jgi:hypothetical protein
MSKEVEKLTPMQEELLSRADSIFATMKEAAKPLAQLTVKEVKDQILETKTKEPLNYSKIQRLQLLLDKLIGE